MSLTKAVTLRAVSAVKNFSKSKIMCLQWAFKIEYLDSDFHGFGIGK